MSHQIALPLCDFHKVTKMAKPLAVPMAVGTHGCSNSMMDKGIWSVPTIVGEQTYTLRRKGVPVLNLPVKAVWPFLGQRQPPNQNHVSSLRGFEDQGRCVVRRHSC